MGRDKAFLIHQSKPLLSRALHAVREAGATEVFVSGRADQDFSPFNCPVLLDLKPACGPLGGIERGLSAAKHPLVLVLAVDLPQMTSNCLRWMGQHRCVEAENGGAVVGLPIGSTTGVIPVLDERFEPLAALYPKSAHRIVKGMLGGHRFAAREFAERCVRDGLVTTLSVPEDRKGCFANWNTPEDVIG